MTTTASREAPAPQTVAATAARPGPRDLPPFRAEAPSKRVLSLDAFRGLAVFGMLLVNNKALGPWTPAQLTHAGWNQGIHLADLVYPWFLLIVGVAIPYSEASARGRGVSRWGYALKVVHRAAILVLLGCLINSSYARHPMFDLGVLQLIGFAYLAGALLYGLPLAGRLLVAAELLAAHWVLLRFLPVPGAGVGALGPSQNPIAYLNQTYLGQWELENVPAVLPTAALVVIGTAIGDGLRSRWGSERRKVGLLLAGGLALALAGWLWSLDLPLNKRLWTGPFILFAAGWGAMVLGAVHFLTEVKRHRRWVFPLQVMGVNAITAFVLPMLVNIHVLREWGWRGAEGAFLSLQQHWLGLFTGHAGAGLGGLLYTTSYLLAWWLVLFYLYRKRIYLRV